jgi:hypothetical protein
MFLAASVAMLKKRRRRALEADNIDDVLGSQAVRRD